MPLDVYNLKGISGTENFGMQNFEKAELHDFTRLEYFRILLYIMRQITHHYHVGMWSQNRCNFATVKRFNFFSKLFLQ